MYYHLDPTPQLRQILDKAYRSPLANRMLVVLGQPLKKDGDIKSQDIYRPCHRDIEQIQAHLLSHDLGLFHAGRSEDEKVGTITAGPD